MNRLRVFPYPCSTTMLLEGLPVFVDVDDRFYFEAAELRRVLASDLLLTGVRLRELDAENDEDGAGLRVVDAQELFRALRSMAGRRGLNRIPVATDMLAAIGRAAREAFAS